MHHKRTSSDPNSPRYFLLPTKTNNSTNKLNDMFLRREQKLALVEKEKKMRQEIIQENNGWNSELEMIVAAIGERAAGYKWMHSKAASYYNKLYQYIGIVSIILVTGAGTGTVTQISTCRVDPATGQPASNWVLILVGIFMYITALVLALKQFKNWGDRSSRHKNAESNYAALEHNIRIMLGVYRKDRQVGKDYAEWITKESDDLISSTPSIPGHIETLYKKEIDGQPIAVANKIQKINIKNEVTSTRSETESHEDDYDGDNNKNDVIVDLSNVPNRKESNYIETEVMDIETPFQTKRYKYEVERFLNGT
jgi:hypothetical protein